MHDRRGRNFLGPRGIGEFRSAFPPPRHPAPALERVQVGAGFGRCGSLARWRPHRSGYPGIMNRRLHSRKIKRIREISVGNMQRGRQRKGDRGPGLPPGIQGQTQGADSDWCKGVISCGQRRTMQRSERLSAMFRNEENRFTEWETVYSLAKGRVLTPTWQRGSAQCRQVP